MEEIDLTKTEFSNNRYLFRKELINIFLNELPGNGKGELSTRYKYIVKFLKNGNCVYLMRPANVNNGFDFTLNVENINFNFEGKRYSSRPTHDNILNDLKNKEKENKPMYTLLSKQIDLIFECKNPTQTEFDFKTGYPSELILECLKWLFEEQDVTYWNYSGRNMLYAAIKK